MVGLACFLGTLLLGPIIGIIIAFVLSLINLALRASKPPIDVLAESDGEVQALIEAKRSGITPFLITVDKEGHDYMKEMCSDVGYEVVDDIEQLPRRLTSLYRVLATD